MEPKGKFLGRGSTRFVYALGPRWVLKIPHDEFGDGLGQDANNWEASQFAKWGRKPDPDGVVRARCRLLSNGWLLMERVVKLRYPLKFPDWADCVDGRQVGVARDGTIVAYDYGL